jgi:putative IMPACT (imprinted ancient) family translation regulator
VVRYFGGTKLGVSGLINAYKTATREAIEAARISSVDLTKKYALHFEYPKLNDVMRIIKEEKITIIEQDFQTSCVIKIEINKSLLDKTFFRLENLYGLEIKPLGNSHL